MMNYFKKSVLLILTVAIFTSCEEEILEVNQFTTEDSVASRSELQPSNLEFFFDEEEFPCSGNLPYENFNEFYGDYGSPGNPLDHNSTDLNIPKGVSFEAQSGLHIHSDNYYEGSWYKSLFSSGQYQDLIINFSTNVLNVGMLVHNRDWSDITEIEIYGNAGLIQRYYTSTTTYYGTYVGFTSQESITKIVLKGEYPGVDNLTFGNCADYDNDGILNEEDVYPNSNMDEMLSIGRTNFDIENQFSDEGTTMMDQIDALIAQINEQYDGRNGDALHRMFTRELSKITYYWYKSRLISRRERTQISRAASNMSIPFYNQEPG